LRIGPFSLNTNERIDCPHLLPCFPSINKLARFAHPETIPRASSCPCTKLSIRFLNPSPPMIFLPELPSALATVKLIPNDIAKMGYDDCPPHPTWIEPIEWLEQRCGQMPVCVSQLQLARRPIHRCRLSSCQVRCPWLLIT